MTSSISNQTKQLEVNLGKWTNFVQEVAQVTAQFTDTVESLQTQIDDMQLTIDALTAKINAMAEASPATTETYVKLSDQQIMLFTSKNTYYQQAIGVFSNAPKVYVTSNLTVDGLTFNGIKVSKGQFYTMDGVESGAKYNIKAQNVNKTGNIVLTFCTSTALTDPSVNLTIKMQYNKVNIQPVTTTASYSKAIGTFTKAVEQVKSTKNEVDNIVATIQNTIAKANYYAKAIGKYS